MATVHQNTQELSSNEPSSILQQAIVLHAKNIISMGIEYKEMLDHADKLVGNVKLTVKDNLTNYLINSLNSPDNSTTDKLASTVQASVLLTAAELLPESVPGVVAMAMPVKGLAGSARAPEFPIAGAMLSAAENLSGTLPSAEVVELAVYDAEELRLLAIKAEGPKLLAEAELELNTAVQAADTSKMAQAAKQYSEVAKVIAPDAMTATGADKLVEKTGANLIYAQKVEALVERRLQLAIAIEKGDFQEIKSAAHQFQDKMTQIYRHRAMPIPGAEAFEQASLMANRVEETVKQLNIAKDQNAALQQLMQLAIERNALELRMQNTLAQPTSLASRVLMDSAKSLAEEAIQQRTVIALPEIYR